MMPDAADQSSPSTCPVCGGGAAPYCTRQGYGGRWHVHRCTACGYGFVANRPTIERLVAIYSKDASHVAWDAAVTVARHERRADARNLAARVAALAKPRGRSLDVGCGDGAFSFHLQAQGFRP